MSSKERKQRGEGRNQIRKIFLLIIKIKFYIRIAFFRKVCYTILGRADKIFPARVREKKICLKGNSEVAKLLSVRKDGATFLVNREKVSVSFKECAENFKIDCGGSGHSVCSRDIRRYRFVFYSEPRIEVRLHGLFKGLRFRIIQSRIERTGYRTYDIS